MKTIIFDETNPAFITNGKRKTMNYEFLVTQTNYLKDKCRHHGYIYLDTVYTALGVAWNPAEKNVCYLETEGGINFEIEPREDGAYLVHIS